jgi:hypothetical protein
MLSRILRELLQLLAAKSRYTECGNALAADSELRTEAGAGPAGKPRYVASDIKTNRASAKRLQP